MIGQILLILGMFCTAVAYEANCATKFSELGFSISTVICPAGCMTTTHNLCGTGFYGDGPVCLAGIHAGRISNFGGVAHVFFTKGFTHSNGSTSFGVQTSGCGSRKIGYSFDMTCSTKGNTEFDVNEVVCPPNCQSYNVYGNELYSDNSSVCASAIHAGAIGLQGGLVTIYTRAGSSSYKNVTSNGIRSRASGYAKRSFNFKKMDECASNPCINGGTCVNLIIGYGCRCINVFFGKRCESKWLFPGNGYKYHIRLANMTYNESKSYCQTLGGHLAEKRLTKTNLMRSMIASMKAISVDRIYIGLTLINGSWIWADGSPANDVPWYPNQPSGGENCAELLEYRGSFGINDVPCDGKWPKGALCAVKLT